MKHSLLTEFQSQDSRPIRIPKPVPTLHVPVYAAGIKRAFDFVVALALLVMVAPVILGLALAIRRDGGPAFFGHQRVGRNGQVFTCWKLRTMVPDAQEKLRVLLARDSAAQRMWQQERKLAGDPRVTALGHTLRSLSFDELPQLINVLRGEMSLVGPRPVPHDELVQNYGAMQKVYLAMRPGITGLWQVSGRNNVDYAQRIKLDSRYHQSLSFRTDLIILARTALVVLRRTGR